MWKKPKKNSLGFSLVEILIVMAIVGVLVAIAVPAALQQRHKSTDAAMKSDLLQVQTGIASALQSWRDVPPADVPLSFNSSTSVWSIVYGATTIVSGTSAVGDAISGTIWADGSYCAQVANSNGSNNWIFRSDTRQISSGTCPVTALGGLGSLPTSTSVVLPGSVTGFTAVNTAGLDNSVDLAWTATSGATSYSVSAVGATTTTVTVVAPSTSTTIANISGGDTSFSIRAVNASGPGLATTINLTVNGGTLLQSGITTPLTTSAGSSTLSRVQIGTTGLGLGGSTLTSDASTLKFGTNASLATAAWIAGRADGGINVYTQTAGGSIINNLAMTPANNTFNNDVKITSGTVSTSTSTGALTVTGGVGIGGMLTVNNITINGTCSGTGCASGGGGSITVANDTTTNGSFYPLLSTATSGTLATANTSSTKLSFNPSTGVLSTNISGSTGLPLTGLSGLGAGIATFLGTPSSANLGLAVTGGTGTGGLVFATSPTLITPNLGTPSSLTLTNATGLPVSTGLTGASVATLTFLGTPSSANLASAITDETGTGLVVFNQAPTLNAPVFTGGVVFNGATSGTVSLASVAVGNGSFFLPNITGSDTLVGKATVDTLTNKTLTDAKIHIGVNAQSGTSYTFALTDDSKLVVASNTSAQNYYIPTDAAVNFAVGTQINLVGIGTGVITVSAATPATTTITSNGIVTAAPQLRTQYSAATLIKTGANAWLVVGDILSSGATAIPPRAFVKLSVDITGFNASTQTNPVKFDSVVYNVGNAYNPATGLFTAPVSGNYIVQAGILSSTTAVSQVWMILNGARIQSLVADAGTSTNVSGGGFVYLNAGDTLGVTPFFGGAVSSTITANTYHTFFRVSLASAG